MARKRRLDFPGAIWHLTDRGNDRRTIYRDRNDFHKFLETLAEVVVCHQWRLFAYVLMPNHYHLLAETPTATLSVGMKSLNEQFAEWFNWRHGRVGHLFQGRFKSIPVERESHLLELARYIVLNPVRCGMVADAGEWEWSSYRATVGSEPAPQWLDVAFLLDLFGGAERYAEFVREGGRQRRRPTLDELARSVSREFGEGVGARYSRSESRKTFARLAVSEGHSRRQVGDWLGISAWAVSKLIAADEQREREDSVYRESFARLQKVEFGV
jgi:REP element-mobilizing transposase RayT